MFQGVLKMIFLDYKKRRLKPPPLTPTIKDI